MSTTTASTTSSATSRCLPRPIQQPIPIWVVSNPNTTQVTNVATGYRRVARLGDGWMTTGKTAPELRDSLAMIRGYARELGRELPASFEVCNYYNINVNDDREAALAESKRFLDDYYTVNYTREYLSDGAR